VGVNDGMSVLMGVGVGLGVSDGTMGVLMIGTATVGGRVGNSGKPVVGEGPSARGKPLSAMESEILPSRIKQKTTAINNPVIT
jgi:hypothetical protein